MRVTARTGIPFAEFTTLPSTFAALLCKSSTRIADGRANLRRETLFRAPSARDPSSVRVKYYCVRLRRKGWNPFDHFRAFEEQPDLGGEDLELRASWLAWQSVAWASLRDFTRADDCLKQAHSLAPQDGWVWSCESQALGLADRWEDALKAAERACEISPGAPYAVHSLGNALLNLGRVKDSAERLAASAENTESFEVALGACWHQCALAETLNGDDRPQVLVRARRLAENLEALAPLVDRDTNPIFARARLDVAELLNDREQMEKWAAGLNSPFHRAGVGNSAQ